MSVSEQTESVNARHRPEVTVQKLSRCASCQLPHPLARDYWKQTFEDNAHCPGCGEPVAAPGVMQLASAYLNFPLFTKIMFLIAEGLRWLARKVDP